MEKRSTTSISSPLISLDPQALEAELHKKVIGQQGELPKGGTWHMGRWGSSLESGAPAEETKTEVPAGNAGC